MNKNIKNIKNGIIEGYGSFGIVISTPRIPYENEHFLMDISEDEVSKIFYEIYDYDNEINFYNRMHLLEINLEIGIENEYFIIPKRYGKINNKLTEKIYDKINFIKLNSHININKLEKIYNYLIDTRYQITFKKGKDISLCNLINFFKYFNNILKCLIELYNKNLILFDIKNNNILYVDKTFKFCDFTSLKNINDIKLTNLIETSLYDKKNYFLINYHYYIHPGIIKIFIKYLLYCNQNIENKNILIIFNYINEIIQVIDIKDEYIVYFYDKLNYFYKIMNLIFTNNIINEIYFYDIIIDKYNIYEILDSILHEKIFNKSKKYYIKYLNFLYKKCGKNLLKELYCLLDLYSIGILIIKFLINKLEQFNDKDIVYILSENKSLILKYIHIILMCCLHYHNNKYYFFNINDVYNYYIN
jgi:hypothetical protein